MDSQTDKAAGASSFLQLASKFVLWLGGSASAISLFLTGLGYLVEHARLDRLGVPRSLYEASPTEYIVIGGKFLLGLAPLAAAGSVHFVSRYWWLAVVTVLTALLSWWKDWSTNWRWLAFAGCLALSLSFVAAGRWDENTVAMFTFLTVAAIAYCYVEIVFATGPARLASRVACQLPFFAVLSCAVVALPYLRGTYGLSYNYPVVKFLGKDEVFFRELASGSVTQNHNDCVEGLWELIDIGKQRVILRNVCDTKVYLVPSGAVSTFRIVGTSKGDH
jgi:hypothetical protein